MAYWLPTRGEVAEPGLRRTPGERVNSEGFRGFKSPPLRQAVFNSPLPHDSGIKQDASDADQRTLRAAGCPGLHLGAEQFAAGGRWPITTRTSRYSGDVVPPTRTELLVDAAIATRSRWKLPGFLRLIEDCR